MVHRMVKIYLSFKTVRRFFHFPLHLKYEGKFVWPYNINLSIWRRKLRILLPSYCYLKLNKSHDSQIEHSAKIKTCERNMKNFIPTKQSFQRMSWINKECLGGSTIKVNMKFLPVHISILLLKRLKLKEIWV